MRQFGCKSASFVCFSKLVHLFALLLHFYTRGFAPPHPPWPRFPRKVWLQEKILHLQMILSPTSPKCCKNYTTIESPLQDSPLVYMEMWKETSPCSWKKEEINYSQSSLGICRPSLLPKTLPSPACVCLEAGEKKPFTLTCGTPWMSVVSGLLGDWTPLREPDLAALPGLARPDMKRLQSLCGKSSRHPTRCWQTANTSYSKCVLLNGRAFNFSPVPNVLISLCT